MFIKFIIYDTNYYHLESGLLVTKAITMVFLLGFLVYIISEPPYLIGSSRFISVTTTTNLSTGK